MNTIPAEILIQYLIKETEKPLTVTFTFYTKPKNMKKTNNTQILH